MAVADDEGDAGSHLRSVAVLLGRNRLDGIGRTLVERRMGADRQRDQAEQGDTNSHRASGDAELPYIHHVPFPIVDQAHCLGPRAS